jgi:hypothetical protein
MGIQVQRTKSEPIPAGLYAATIEDVAQETGKFGEQLKVKFLIEEEGFEGKVLAGWASLAFSPKSKLYGWVRCAVFGGRDVPADYQVFDSDHLIGRRVFLSVDTAKGDNGEIYNKVKDLLPYRRSAAQPPKPAENAQPPAVTTRAASAAPSKPSDPPDWPDWDEASLRDPGPTDEDEA